MQEYGVLSESHEELINDGNEALESAEPTTSGEEVELGSDLSSLKESWTDQDLILAEFPPPAWVVPGLIPEGLTILAGKPKIGKSLLCLQLAVELSQGLKALGRIPLKPQESMYLALEDGARRLKHRLKRMLGANPASGKLHIRFTSPRGDFVELARLLDQHRNLKLVVVDTFSRIRSRSRRGAHYDADHDEVSALRAIADERHLALVLVHHLRKTGGDDLVDLVLGSTGLTAAADDVAVLTKATGDAQAILNISGRDREPVSLALTFDRGSLSHRIAGLGKEFEMSKERRQVLEILRKNGNVMSLGDISQAAGKKRPVVHKHLQHLIDAGFVEQPEFAKYQIRQQASDPHNKFWIEESF
jgi:hypothetical protein